MSRAPAGDVVEVAPSSNVYTVLVAVALVVQLIAFAAMVIKAGEVFVEGKSLFS
jgi:hypothetical protein